MTRVSSDPMQLHVFDESEMAANSARLIAELIRQSAADGPISVGLAGGSTPKPVYELLRWEPVPFERVGFWLSDERWVPYDHPDSNGGMAAAALLDHVESAFYRPPMSDHMRPEDSAAHYEATLRHLFAGGRPDVVLLGMGDDGHTASLFPGTEALEAPENRWFVSNWVETQDAWRLTATRTLLTSARQVVLFVAGEGKADRLAEVLEGPDDRYPAQLIRHVTGEAHVVADRAAASALTG